MSGTALGPKDLVIWWGDVAGVLPLRGPALKLRVRHNSLPLTGGQGCLGQTPFNGDKE